MKLSLVSADVDLQKALNDTGYFTEVVIAQTLEDTRDSQVVVISDHEVHHNELSLFYSGRQEKKKNQVVFFMISNLSNDQALQNITAICESKNIVTIPPMLTMNQIVDRIIKKLFPEIGGRNQNIAVFFGADSKVGTTMTAQVCAEMLAKNTDLKIALLHLNENPGTHYFKIREEENVGIDDIKIRLFNNILTADELFHTCIQQKGLFVLQGPKSLLDIRHYHPEHLENLIQLAREVFDVIIIDAGFNIRTGMAVGALRSSNIRYLVTTQQETARKEFERMESQIFKALQMETSDFLLIANKYVNTSSIYTGKQLADLYKMSLAGTIPHMEFSGWQAEIDQKSLIHYENEGFNAQVEQLCKLIAAQMKIEYKNNLQPQAGWLSRIVGNKRRGE